MKNNTFLQNHGNQNVKVIAVSKTKSKEAILEVYKRGQRDFGENKVQELVSKQADLPADIKWHLIGHLQKNKVKMIAPFIELIHSVDSLELLQTIDKFAKINNRIINVLLQVRIAQEETKFGMLPDQVEIILEMFIKNSFPNVKICGLMGMASFTDNEDQINKEFSMLHDLYIEVKEVYLDQAYYFKELSMGMSNDYEIAIENGATMVRIGTLIFGQRF